MIYFIILFAVVLLYLTYKFVKLSNYWKSKGIAYKRPWPVFGNFQELILRRKNVAYVVEDLYKEFPNKRYFGSFQFTTPALMITDLDLIKRITVKDFEHFVDRIHIPGGDNLEPIFSKNLLMLRGQKWKDMRATLSPSFTGTKIRIMFELISRCASNFTDHFSAKDEDVVEVEMKNLMSRLAIDIIATTTFGVECDSIKGDNEFYRLGMKTMTTGFVSMVKSVLMITFPGLAKKLGLSFLPRDVVDFFENAITDTLKERKEKNIVRPDMIHIMTEAQKHQREEHQKVERKDIDTGFAAVDEHIKPAVPQKDEITTTDIVAQGLLFFIAGFETISTLLSHTFHELAVNTDVQEKLRNEIDGALEGTDLTYEKLVGMRYLDMVVSETLRKWPPAVLVNRECVKDYVVEPDDGRGEGTFVIERGMGIAIPTYGIHRDPRYYEEPDKFDPERFNDENKHKIRPYTYMPFGVGPRNCIGSRFALLETKMIVVCVLREFDVVPVAKTQVPLVLSPKKGGLVNDGFYLGLKKRSK